MIRTIGYLSTSILVLSSVGCISDPTYVEEDFGNSVRQMVAAQIQDPTAASQPDSDPPLWIDGVVSGHTVTGYRDRAKDKEEDPLFTFTFR